MQPGDIVVDANGRKLTRVMKMQREQTLAYWVHRGCSVEKVQKDITFRIWRNDGGWPWEVRKSQYTGYVCNEGDDILHCAVDELDGPEENEFGPVIP
jgi:hypothetical protein